uniref:Uncharacterized protein n=1 Tax=Anopheles culicifacies TaxID=139723 RepID=A0A182M5V5_9DIPT
MLPSSSTRSSISLRMMELSLKMKRCTRSEAAVEGGGGRLLVLVGRRATDRPGVCVDVAFRTSIRKYSSLLVTDSPSIDVCEVGSTIVSWCLCRDAWGIDSIGIASSLVAGTDSVLSVALGESGVVPSSFPAPASIRSISGSGEIKDLDRTVLGGGDARCHLVVSDTGLGVPHQVLGFLHQIVRHPVRVVAEALRLESSSCVDHQQGVESNVLHISNKLKARQGHINSITARASWDIPGFRGTVQKGIKE